MLQKHSKNNNSSSECALSNLQNKYEPLQLFKYTECSTQTKYIKKLHLLLKVKIWFKMINQGNHTFLISKC